MTNQEHYSSSTVRSKFKMAITKSELDTMRSVLNHVWILTDTQKSVCDKWFMKQTTASKLIKLIDKTHDYLDFITVQGSGYRINYVNGSTAWLEDLIDKGLGNTPVLLSFRGSKEYKTFCCLALIRNINDIPLDNIGEL